MDVLLPMQPGRPEFGWLVLGNGELGAGEPQLLGEPIISGLNVGDLAIEVIEAHHRRTAVQVEMLEQPRPWVHGVVELERQAGVVLNPHGLSLTALEALRQLAQR